MQTWDSLRTVYVSLRQLRKVLALGAHAALAMVLAALRRLAHGPRLPGWSWALECTVAGIGATIPQHESASLNEVRYIMDRNSALPLPSEVVVRPVSAGGLSGEWVCPQGFAENAVMLYLHGGGYLFGSPASHRHLVAALAQTTGMRILVIDYRLAPEHPYPAALEDAWAAYWWLLSQGFDPTRLVVAGESAGGGLTISLLLALRDAGVPLPACAVCISPWVDMTLARPSLRTNEATDYLNLSGMQAAVPYVLGDADPQAPSVSPVFANLSGLPPLLIQAGTAEMLLDDARSLAQHAAAHGVAVELELWENMVHAWHFMFAFEPAARDAIRHIGLFVRRHVTDGPAAAPGATEKTHLWEFHG